MSHDFPIAYALDDEGLPLSVIDVTNPAFALDPDERELEKRVSDAIEQMRSFADPSMSSAREAFVREARSSRLASSLVGGEGAVEGLATYRAKLGPEGLGAQASDFDRALADSLPCYSCRLRLRDTSRLLASSALAALGEPLLPARAPLVLVDVASGAAADALNALILARARDPGALEGRPLAIYALDPEQEGAAFALRALEALSSPGFPLSGLKAELIYLPYDWAEPRVLRELLTKLGAAGAACALSSEGGLFEYASPKVIAANLEAAREGLSAGRGRMAAPPWVGTAARVDGSSGFFCGSSPASARRRPIEELEAELAASGYVIEELTKTPLSLVFRADRAQGL